MDDRSAFEKTVFTILEWGGELLLSVGGLGLLLLVGWLISRAFIRGSKDDHDRGGPPQNLGP